MNVCMYILFSDFKPNNVKNSKARSGIDLTDLHQKDRFHFKREIGQ